MNVYVMIDGRWSLRGSYPDNNSPHIAKAVADNVQSWQSGGYRVKIDDIEVNAVSADRMAATREQFEVVTMPRAARSYETMQKAA